MKKKDIILITSLLVMLDQTVKFFASTFLNNSIKIINNFLYIDYVENTGAAFGIMNGSIFLLIIVSVILIKYIIEEIKVNNKKSIVLSFVMILSGAFGNLIDRIFRGYVIDYISFEILGRQMPVFNLADSYIVIGAFLIFISFLRGYYDNKSK